MNIWIIALLVFLAFDVILVIWIYFFKKKRSKLSTKSLTYIRSHWIRIIDSFHAHPAQSILDADKLLDYALGQHGFVGTLGEKLKKAGPRFRDLNSVWSAHKLRNRLAHELGEQSVNEAKRALAHFKQALNDLGAQL